MKLGFGKIRPLLSLSDIYWNFLMLQFLLQSLLSKHHFPKQVALSVEAERVLAEAIQENLKGDVIYFWAHLDMVGGVIGSRNALTFWSMCDILNGGNCRYKYEHRL